MKNFKSGHIAIIGKPNVGKSSIMNFLIKERLSIVTSKPETTRGNIAGILNMENAQLIFLDTPGTHKPRNILGKNMVRQAEESLHNADIIVFVVDAQSGIREEDDIILGKLKHIDKPVLCAINKVDIVKKPKVLPIMDKISKSFEFKEIIPLSAVDGTNMDILLSKILDFMNAGPKLFDDEQYTDKSEKFIVSELIREKVLNLTWQEIPHSVAVFIEEFKQRENKNLMYIRGTILVEKQSQKKIVIGNKASMLKKIGELARKDIESLLNKKVYLELWVKVQDNWRKDAQILKKLGYL